MISRENEMWYTDITILAKNTQRLWPSYNMNLAEQINALTRLFLVVTILGYVITQSHTYLLTGILFIALIALYGYAKKHNMINYFNKPMRTGFLDYLSNKEGFVPNMNNKDIEEHIKQEYKTLSVRDKKYEQPTDKNPLSNVLLTDIQDNPTRNPAPPAYLESVERKINEKTKEMIKGENPDITDIEKRLFTEVGDNFTFDRGMRQFYSMPNTQIPNDQKGFVEFCYGSMVSCKEGDEQACERNAFRHMPGY
jgi:hypothetical protein